MKVIMCNVYNKKTGIHTGGEMFRTQGEAREFYLKQFPKQDLNPADFQLAEVGKFDILTGQYDIYSTPEIIPLYEGMENRSKMETVTGEEALKKMN